MFDRSLVGLEKYTNKLVVNETNREYKVTQIFLYNEDFSRRFRIPEKEEDHFRILSLLDQQAKQANILGAHFLDDNKGINSLCVDFVRPLWCSMEFCPSSSTESMPDKKSVALSKVEIEYDKRRAEDPAYSSGTLSFS